MKRRPILALLLCALAPAAAHSQSSLWTNFTNSGNTWANTVNWTNGVPTSTVTAIITTAAGTSYSINHDAGTNAALYIRLGNSSSQTATLNVAAGSQLSAQNTTGGGLENNSLQMTTGARLNVTGTVVLGGGFYAQNDSIINVNGGLLLVSNRNSRINNTGSLNVLDGGRVFSSTSFELAGVGGAENARLNVVDGSARFTLMNIGFRSTGVVTVGASGTLTNFGGDWTMAGNPPSGNHVSVGMLFSTGNVFNTGSLILGGNLTNANAMAAATISGGTFLQAGVSSKAVNVGDRNRGALTVEGGAFLSTNHMNVGNQNYDLAAGRLQRGNGAVLVTGTGALAVTNAAGDATIRLGNSTAVADTERAIGQLTVASGTLDADRLLIHNGAFTNSGGSSTIGTLIATNGNASLSFSAGTLRLVASTLSNGIPFIVGNGIQSATLDLIGNGAHAIAGGLQIASNAALIGAGTITGSLTNLGTIAPGHSPGTLDIAGDAFLGSSSILLMELGGTNTSEFDQLNVTGILGFDGVLTVSLTNSFTPQIGDVFDLFDFGGTNGLTFAAINLPVLLGAAWDTTDLYIDGSITVIPEPQAFALLLFGAVFFFAVRRGTRKD